MEEAIRKAGVLVEALNWIRQFRGKYVVIKLGGSALDRWETVRCLLTDVIFMSTVGMKPILVHGGGKAISRAMKEAGVEPRFVEGRRYTDERTLEIVTRVLAQEVCQRLVQEICEQGGRAVALTPLSNNCLIAERLELTGRDGHKIDLGHVGYVVDVDRSLIERACRDSVVPIIPSVAQTRSGEKLNVNADTAAAAVARLIGAEKLVFLSDVPGILGDPQDDSSVLSHVTAAKCRELIANGIIASGMIPKVDAALEALAAGVRKVHIVDGRVPHSLLLEIYSDKGIGTEIVA